MSSIWDKYTNAYAETLLELANTRKICGRPQACLRRGPVGLLTARLHAEDKLASSERRPGIFTGFIIETQVDIKSISSPGHSSVNGVCLGRGYRLGIYPLPPPLPPQKGCYRGFAPVDDAIIVWIGILDRSCA